MKIQCNVCEAAEAAVLCCADEAALCWVCDEKVHAANKLAGKHQRVPLTKSSSSTIPKCDICQEASGYFFCLEDRALLCRNCDAVVHSANSFVSDHQRFLITGVKIGKQATEGAACSADQRSGAAIKDPNQGLKVADLLQTQHLYTGEAISGMASGWPLDEFFGYTDNVHPFGFPNRASSEADSGNLVSKEGSPTYRSSEEETGDIQCLGADPEAQLMMVPEISSPPTASGMHWRRDPRQQLVGDTAFVPDLRQCQRGSPTSKRRRWLT